MTSVTRDEEFYTTLVTFKVQDILFRVSVEEFKTQSEIFRDMFAFPQEAKEGSPPEGTSDASPIILEGVKVDEFRALLRYLYPRKYGATTQLSQSDWIGIHALAHMWGFEEAKEASKAFLLNINDSITKLELGARFGYDDWLRKAYEELCNRPNSLSIEEARRVGLEAATHIAQIRELRFKSLSSQRVVQTVTRLGYSSRAEQKQCCPHCAKPVQIDFRTPYLFDDPATNSSERIASCLSCNITLFGDSAIAAKSISNRINEEILKLIPSKSVIIDKGNGGTRKLKQLPARFTLD